MKSNPPLQSLIDDVEKRAVVDDTLPWNVTRYPDDYTKSFNLRVPIVSLIKLRWLSENTPQSMQQICHEILLSEIDNRVDDLLKLK